MTSKRNYKFVEKFEFRTTHITPLTTYITNYISSYLIKSREA